METGALLHILWRRRILVVIGAVLALLVALKVGDKPGAGDARAKVDVLLDTHESQLVDARPPRVASLSWRAHLLSQLLGTQSAQKQIASRADISSEELAVIDSELAVPTIPASLPRVAAEASADPPEPYVLTVESDAMAPLVSLRARGPDRDAAARLANAAVVTLATSAAPGGVAAADTFAAGPVAPVMSRDLGGADQPTLTAAIALALFGIWCAVLVLAPAIAGALRPSRSGPASAIR